MKKGIGRTFLLGLSLALFFLHSDFVSTAASGLIPTKDKKEYRVKNRAENDACILSAASRYSHETEGEQIFYVTGENYMPEGSILSVYFGDQMEYSSTVTGRKTVRREEGEEKETTVRFAVRWRHEGMEPGPGHEGGAEGDAEGRYWRLGDELFRRIYEETYRFVCIDEEFRGTRDGRQGALFLCDQVIPPDTEEGISSFGETSSYKTSLIRRWLGKAQLSEGLWVPTGADRYYMGQTEAGRWEQLKPEGLRSVYAGHQEMEDRLFVLSVEEALSYGRWLWRFENAMGAGEEKENPDSQLCGIQKAYWLRTPAGDERLTDSGQVYVVDLLSGNIRPERITAENVGVRPAFVLPQ